MIGVKIGILCYDWWYEDDIPGEAIEQYQLSIDYVRMRTLRAISCSDWWVISVHRLLSFEFIITDEF